MSFKKKEPKVALIESIRSIGYNFNSALADIVDNSISAEARNIQIKLIPSIPAIVIIDDGCGMSSEELDSAMDLGSKNPNDTRSAEDLGRFGLGLKSASFSQCTNLTVTSLKDGKLSSMTWDLKTVAKEGDWLIEVNDEEKIKKLPYIDVLEKNKHGTIVQWMDFDRIKNSNADITAALNKLLLDAYQYLALVFHKYIAANKVNILINDNVLEKRDPFLHNRNDAQHFKPDPIPITNTKYEQCVINVITHILPYAKNLTSKDKVMMGNYENMRNQQGFYVYRNDRLIIWGTWLHMMATSELYKNARIEVNIPNTLDDIWEVDIKKASATIPGIIKQALFAHVKKAIDSSSKVYKKRGENTSNQVGHQVVWNISEERDSYEITINKDNPLIKQLKSELNQSQIVILDTLLKDIESNLPKKRIYTNEAESKNTANKQNVEIIENNIREMLDSMACEDGQKIIFLAQLFQCEPYCLYAELYEKLVGELSND